MHSEDPDGLGTITSPEHQYVGSVTGDMTICRCIASSSTFTFGSRGCGIFLGAYKYTGLASERSVIVQSRPILLVQHLRVKYQLQSMHARLIA